MQDNLSKLVKAMGISGYENAGDIMQVIQDLVGYPGENIESNLVYSLGKGKKTVFLSAHLDEVGFFISQVRGKFIQIVPIGDVNIQDLWGEKLVLLKNQSKSKKVTKAKTFSSLKISGFYDAQIGDICTFEKTTTSKANYFESPALDNRVSCLALINILKKLEQADLPFQLIVAFVGREEISVNGLMSAVKKYDPDLCIDVDSAYALPVSKNKQNWQVPCMGKGPAIQLLGNGFIIQSDIRYWIEETAKLSKLDFQYEIPGDSQGGTNAKTLISAGYQTAQINIPVFNQHSAKSRVALTDIQNTTTLILALLKNMKGIL